ncbi:MAG: two-partner secretion domain-containing protein, partial [Planctomycetota bacterium]
MKSIRRISKKYYLRQFAASFLAFCMVFALPVQVVMAEVVMTSNPTGAITVSPLGGGSTQDMTATNGSIGIFSDFDIAAGHTVTCVQGAPDNWALFKVNGDGTEIYGNFISDGRIGLLDPAGIFIGANATINVNQLIASSLEMTDQAFKDRLDGVVDHFAFESGAGAVINEGTINAPEGVALLGQRVANTGSIVAGENGFVVMAAGDKVLLGEPGSKIIVEMSSATGDIADVGEVINSGSIEAPGGQIVLASGDIFAAAVSDDARAVKVHMGSGEVVQEGSITASAATGDGGTVSLTSGDQTLLGSDSETFANAGTGGDSGLVTIHSADTVIVQSGAQIKAIGGYTPTPLATDPGYVDGLPDEEQDISVVRIVQKNSVEIIGDNIDLLGTIDATATEAGKKGKIYIEADSLTIVDDMPAENTENLIVEEFIENNSDNGVDTELVARSASNGSISAGLLEDGIISGGSGDIVFRTKYMNGVIDLTPRDSEGTSIGEP